MIQANLVDLVNRTIYPAQINIENGKIVEITKLKSPTQGYIIPGFVDAHVHIESSMLPPSEFSRLASIHGSVATVSDPHEIANVLGIKGIEYMLENASTVPFKFYFGAPPCVPATRFETAGAILGPSEIEYLLAKKEIKYLSEVMNFPGVIAKDPDLLAKIAIARSLNKKIDGHAPGLLGDPLKNYVAAGIETDHECTNVEEAREKKKLGMKILIREGSAARNFEALFPLLLEDPEGCMFCSDDCHPDSLSKGHINLLAGRAVEKGMDVLEALRCASLNAVQHYDLEVGLLQIGDPADFILLDDLKSFIPKKTFIDGICVAENGVPTFACPPAHIINNFSAQMKKPAHFRIKAREPFIKVIEAIDGELLTRKKIEPAHIENGWIVSNIEQDILKIAVVNRHIDAIPSVAFVHNFGLKKGAIASSVAHDSHNIIAVGVDDESLCRAVNCVIRHQGAIALVSEGKEECLPLPIAGLMSNLRAEEVAALYEHLNCHARQMSKTLSAPFMTLSFMALLVIPSLKISDLGIFDQEKFCLTDIFANTSLA